MRLVNEFSVDAPIEDAWSVLTDIKVLCRTPMVLFGRNAF